MSMRRNESWEDYGERLKAESERRAIRAHAREELAASLKTRHQRVIVLGDGNGCQARRHMNLEQAHTDDEFFSTGVIESARLSMTCQALDEDELEAQTEEYLQFLKEQEEAEHPNEDGGSY